MDITTDTDSFDGATEIRQLKILFTDIALMIASWFAIKYLQYGILMMGNLPKTADSYLEKGYIPLTLLLWGAIWIPLILTRGFVNPAANHIQATHNPLYPKFLSGGGMQFIVYRCFALRFMWEEKQGTEIVVEREEIIESLETTISIKKISLVIQLRGLYRPHLERLSAFLQNHVEANGVKSILDFLMTSANQYTEEIASGMDSTEEVRAKQGVIITQVLNRLTDEGKRYGIDLFDIKFRKCDYSADTQKELDKAVHAAAILEAANLMSPNIPEHERVQLALTAAGKKTLSETIKTIKMDKDTAEAMKNANPAVAAMILGGAMLGGNNTPP